ncbi:MAG: hypothetical protein K8R74_06225, partial [Bacteroidales bacterium]|nr:hypothetical protein [Bacteroidales bacterium]
MKKRILHLIATNFYGGPEKQIIEHLLRLNLLNEFQGILCSFIEGKNRNEILEVASKRGVPNFHIIMKNQIDLRALFQIIKVLRKNKIDIIIAHHYKSVILGTVAAKLLGLRILDYSRGFTA